MEFIQILDVLLQDSGITASKLARDIGISPSTISEWRKGKEPRKAALEKIAGYFDVTTDFLLGKSPPSEESELFRLLQEPLAHEMLTVFNQLSELNQEAILAQIRYLIDNKPDA